MSSMFKKTRSVGAFVVAMSMMSPAGNAAGFQTLTVYNEAPAGVTTTFDGARLIQVEAADRPFTARGHHDRRGPGNINRVWKQPCRDGNWGQDCSDRNRDRWHVRNDHHRKGHYRNGHRGYRDYRRGYRQDDDGWWFPLAAFALGAVILNQQNTHHVQAGNVTAHENWCLQKYRSYDPASDTYQPYHGPRKYCISPYDQR